MMRHQVGWTALLVMITGAVALASGFPVTVVDDRGREITISEPPQRVVVAGIPLYSEILVALGQTDRIVGVASSSENPPEVAGLPEIGPVYQPNLEAILALEPDLVLGASPTLREQLEALGIVVLSGGSYGMWISDIAGVLETIELVGKALGVEEKARPFIGSIAREILAIEAKVQGRDRPSAAVLYLYDPAGAPYVAGQGTPEDELIARAGGINAFREVTRYAQVAAETVLAQDPWAVFVGTGQLANLTEHVVLGVLTAVSEGRVFEIAAGQLVSTRVAEVLVAMAQALHPAAFPEEVHP